MIRRNKPTHCAFVCILAKKMSGRYVAWVKGVTDANDKPKTKEEALERKLNIAKMIINDDIKFRSYEAAMRAVQR